VLTTSVPNEDVASYPTMSIHPTNGLGLDLNNGYDQATATGPPGIPREAVLQFEERKVVTAQTTVPLSRSYSNDRHTGVDYVVVDYGPLQTAMATMVYNNSICDIPGPIVAKLWAKIQVQHPFHQVKPTHVTPRINVLDTPVYGSIPERIKQRVKHIRHNLTLPLYRLLKRIANRFPTVSGTRLYQTVKTEGKQAHISGLSLQGVPSSNKPYRMVQSNHHEALPALREIKLWQILSATESVMSAVVIAALGLAGPITLVLLGVGLAPLLYTLFKPTKTYVMQPKPVARGINFSIMYNYDFPAPPQLLKRLIKPPTDAMTKENTAKGQEACGYIMRQLTLATCTRTITVADLTSSIMSMTTDAEMVPLNPAVMGRIAFALNHGSLKGDGHHENDYFTQGYERFSNSTGATTKPLYRSQNHTAKLWLTDQNLKYKVFAKKKPSTSKMATQRMVIKMMISQRLVVEKPSSYTRCNYCSVPDRIVIGERTLSTTFIKGACAYHASILNGTIRNPSVTNVLNKQGFALTDLDGPLTVMASEQEPPAVETFPLDQVFPKSSEKGFNFLQAILSCTTTTSENKTKIDFQRLDSLLPAKMQVKRPRVVGVLRGFGLSGDVPTVHSSTAITQIKAAVTRVARKPTHEPQSVAFCLADRWLESKRAEWGWGVKHPPLTEQDWLTTVKNRPLMEQSLEKLKTNKLPKLRWQLFVKAEFGDNEKPRAIQSMPPEWQAYLGPALKSVMYRVKKAWHVDTSTFYAGSSDPDELHHYLQRLEKLRHSHNFDCNDYSMFDCTHSKKSFEFVEKWYARLVYFTRQQRNALKTKRIPKGRLRCGIRYKAPKEQNGSGCPDTSLLNGFISMPALFVSSMAAIHQCEFEQLIAMDEAEFAQAIKKTETMALIVASGDDSVVALHKTADNKQIPRHLNRFGFTVTQNADNTFEDMVFLANRPYPVGGIEYWGPTIGRRAFKHHFCKEPTSHLSAWLRGVAIGNPCPHVPILSDMNAVAALQTDASTANKGKMIEYRLEHEYNPLSQKRLTKLPPPYDETTIIRVAKLYKIDPLKVIDTIRYIREVQELPHLIPLEHHYYYSKMDGR